MNAGAATCGGLSQEAAAARSRAALTLVELLAVVAIIGLLVGLLLPAVQMARESARRSTCGTTLRQWGQAVQSYEQSYGVLPVGMSEWRCVQHSWVPALWSYIDQQPLADRYRWDQFMTFSPNSTSLTANPVGPMTQRLPIYYCPSDKPNATFITNGGIAPRVNYVANSTTVYVGAKAFRGPFRRKFQNGPATYCGVTTSGLSWVVLDTRGYTGPGAWRVAHIVDGLSNTLMMAEAIVWPGEAVAGLPSDPRGTLDNLSFDTRITPNSAFDRVASWYVPPTYAGCIDSPPSLPCQATGGQEWIYASRSRHAGGVQAVMCDGSVRFVSDLVNQSAWQAQGTMNGREALTMDE